MTGLISLFITLTGIYFIYAGTMDPRSGRDIFGKSTWFQVWLLNRFPRVYHAFCLVWIGVGALFILLGLLNQVGIIDLRNACT